MFDWLRRRGPDRAAAVDWRVWVDDNWLVAEADLAHMLCRATRLPLDEMTTEKLLSRVGRIKL